jgi:hypothetical protein
MNASAPMPPFPTAMSLMNNIYFNPIVGALIRHGVPDHLDQGPLAASDLGGAREWLRSPWCGCCGRSLIEIVLLIRPWVSLFCV